MLIYIIHVYSLFHAFYHFTLLANIPEKGERYHTVIFHFLYSKQYNGLFNLDPPLKSTAPFAPKLPKPILLWKWLLPLYFVIRFLSLMINL